MSTAKTMRLPVKLTSEEKIEKGKALADQYAIVADLHVEKTAAASRIKSSIESAEAVAASLARIVRDGAEDREVAVMEQKNFDRRTVETIRLDTHEVVSTRPMSRDDAQAGLFDLAETAGDNAANKFVKATAGKVTVPPPDVPTLAKGAKIKLDKDGRVEGSEFADKPKRKARATKSATSEA